MLWTYLHSWSAASGSFRPSFPERFRKSPGKWSPAIASFQALLCVKENTALGEVELVTWASERQGQTPVVGGQPP